uniref:Molybdopterin biosynthesis protein n=1 Tax=Polysiphonia scopulorum TaxID=257860 RepID=A0A1Z1MIV4_9FLOR|nr:Molybdopterin biosynthesis protein [Polysiphonia scopulorum]ARW65674.1 Molybdopterin biosynthesis protein [Polysiphonia scopulorum]
MLNINTNSYKDLSREEIKIFSKQIILEQLGIEGQIRLKNSKVLVIGAGGLGCPVMMYLAVSGVGNIGIIDNDNIQLSNLNRQILYSIKDINKIKVNTAKEKLKIINSSCNIIRHTYELTKKNSLEVISYYDIIIDTTDNFNTRYLIDEACYNLHKTYIYGAINQFEGQIGIFNYKNGIRYKDLYTKELKLINRDCNQDGIMGISTSYIGNLQAIETIKVILGLNRQCKNFLIIGEIISLKLTKKKISPYNRQMNILKNFKKNKELNKTFTNTEEGQIIIDLRENNQFITNHISKSINIPIYKFKLNKTIKFIKNNTKGKILKIYCNTITRSKTISSILQNYDIKHIIIANNRNR